MADGTIDRQPSRVWRAPDTKFSQFIRLNGKRVDHVCKLPRPLFLIRRFKAGDRWQCACDKVYRWGRHPLMKALGIIQMEWLRV